MSIYASYQKFITAYQKMWVSIIICVAIGIVSLAASGAVFGYWGLPAMALGAVGAAVYLWVKRKTIFA